jgi:isoleucyl-tRNA synthetase
MKFSGIQSEQSKRLGYFMDWDHSYYTMSDENNYMIWHFLKTCYQKGWIYKGRDSVPWCPRCETAISQHEMLTEDYKELTHETVFVKFKIKDQRSPARNATHSVAGGKIKVNVKNLYLLVWTTTPWTVPANVAVGVNIKFTYGIWKNNKNNEAIVIIDTDENGSMPKRTQKGKELSVSDYILKDVEGEWEKTGTVKGSELVGLTYEAPFDHLPRVKEAQKENPKTFHTVVDGSQIVVSTEGTGLLHVAPGAGKEDFDLGKKENLPIISLIADDASYLDGLDDFSGKNAKKHPELIIDFLKTHVSGRYLLKSMHFTHRYPACWRCKAELVWKVTHEWYIAMDVKEKSKIKDQKSKTLREQMIETAKKIDWHPQFGLDRELDWLANMHDWLISKKNRYWGLALPIYECKECDWFTVIGSRDELKKKSVTGWDAFDGHSPHKPFIDEVKIKCEKCGKVVSRLDDVGNVWLDAGIVPFSTYVDPETKALSYTTDKTYWKKWFPIDFITESFPGQFKNWFYSMIAMATVLEKTNPFKTVLGYASMLGEDGRPMHKSWGNAIEFNEGADKIGVDVMRWMFATHNPTENLLFGYKKADETRRKFHLMLWNIYNFFVSYANIDEFKIAKSKSVSKNILDVWILKKLEILMDTVTQSLENYDSFTAATQIEIFVSDLSTWYVRRSRDRIGPTVDNSPDKDACYQTLYNVLVILSQILAPFTPFLSEEIYCNLTQKESVHLSEWPMVDQRSKVKDQKLMQEMEFVRKVCEAGHAKRKELGIKVRQPLKKFKVQNSKFKVEDELVKIIKDELNVKDVEVIEGEGELEVSFDTQMTDELLAEGKARELIRQIQQKRKELGCGLTEKILVSLPSWPKDFESYIKRETLTKEISLGASMNITRLS